MKDENRESWKGRRRRMKKIWEKLENSLVLQIVIFMMLMVPLIIGYRAVKVQLDRRFTVIADDFTWVYQVDSVKEDNDKLKISGFAFNISEDVDLGNCEIILRNIRHEEMLFLKMNFCMREDVNKYFQCDFNYVESGFIAEISQNKIDLKNNDYEIILRPIGAKVGYATGIYLTRSGIVYANPDLYHDLTVEGTDLERITSNGILRVYCPEYGIYVYQLNNELYWIADENYEYFKNPSWIEYHLNTTQVHNLPEERIKNEWYWSNLSFVFESYELKDMEFGKYRVAKIELPTEYSITQIWGGHFESGWAWRCDFRPYYQFDEN